MLASRVISISIPKVWKTVYEAIWRPERFQDWAQGQPRITDPGRGQLEGARAGRAGHGPLHQPQSVRRYGSLG